MQTNSLTILKLLLNRYHEEDQSSLLELLEVKEAEAIQKLDVGSSELSVLVVKPDKLISRIHYSWLVEPIKAFPEGLRQLILSAIPKDQALKLSKLIKLESLSEPISRPVRTYVLKKFYAKVKPKDILPLDVLKETPLKVLGEFSKEKLVLIFDLLSMFDLAEDIRHVVDKEKLGKIQNCLSKTQKNFLRFCLQMPEKHVKERIRLEYWDGDTEKLIKLLHKKGINRVAFALSGESADLIWHIVHKLDTGRGRLLESDISTKAISGTTEVLTNQILTIIKFLKNKGAM